MTPEGQALGALCVIDTIPREITAAQLKALEALSRTVASHLEQGRHIADLERLMLAKDAHVEELKEYSQALEEASSRYREESLIDPASRTARIGARASFASRKSTSAPFAKAPHMRC